MSTRTDTEHFGYFARLTKNGTQIILSEWYDQPWSAIDRLITVMRSAGWPAGPDTPESERQVRAALLDSSAGVGQRVSWGGGYTVRASSGDVYSYEMRAGYRPGYDRATGAVRA